MAVKIQKIILLSSSSFLALFMNHNYFIQLSTTTNSTNRILSMIAHDRAAKAKELMK